MIQRNVRLRAALAVLTAQSLLLAGESGAGAPSIRGFSPEAAAAQHKLEASARDMAQAERIRTYLERMSADPHHAGSPGSKAVAEYANALLKEWGIASKIESFEALMPFPTSRSLELVSPNTFKASLSEPALGDDRDSSDQGQIPTYNAYSATGDVTAPLVYVNYGMPDDYEVLRKMNIDVKGKIVITRYGGGWRGVKAKLAQEKGAVGCLIYSDPKDDGFYRGDVYPKGPFRPVHGVQRGSVLDMPVQVGDPLTPGWASEPGGKRIRREDSKVIMRIPVLPISYGDATPLLRSIGGPVAPENWRGALGLTYHIGAGPGVARLKLDFDWTSKPIHNVIAKIPGSVYPDQWIVLGNHHDAWVNGASDPLSGASALLETARVLAKMTRHGWKPKRTIVFALWDGEEFGLMGSTEWAEKHAAELSQKAVAYINSDSNGRGTFGAGGSHALEKFLNEVLRDVKDPVSGKPLAEVPRRDRSGKPVSGPYKLGALGAGSDYVAFLHHLGISSFNVGFGGEGGGVYHSVYDSFTWFTRFGDPDLAYGRALSQVTTTMTMRLADAAIVPYQFDDLARTAKGYIDQVQKEFPAADLREPSKEWWRLAQAARAFNAEYPAALKKATGAGSSEKIARINALLYGTERALAPQSGGLPGRNWYKHLLYAPGLYTGYGARTLPALRESLDAGRMDEARDRGKDIAKALRDCSVRVEEAVALMRKL